MSTSSEVPRDDVAAALAARRELGAEYEAEVVDTLTDRIDKAIDARVDARLAQRGAREKEGGEGAFWLALGSLGMGIPITGVAGGTGGLIGVLAAWIGIVLVNITYLVGSRR